MTGNTIPEVFLGIISDIKIFVMSMYVVYYLSDNLGFVIVKTIQSFSLENYLPLLLRQIICFQILLFDQTALSEKHLILLDLNVATTKTSLVIYQTHLLQVVYF